MDRYRLAVNDGSVDGKDRKRDSKPNQIDLEAPNPLARRLKGDAGDGPAQCGSQRGDLTKH